MLLADCILGMLTAVCVAGVVIPILSKFRYSKAQSVITAAFFALFIAGMLAAAHCRGLTSQLAGLLEMQMPTVLLIAVICAAVLFVSYHISMRMFEAREF